MDYENLNRSTSGSPYLKVNGRSYTYQEYEKVGASAFQISQSLAQSGDYDLLSFMFSLTANATSQEQAQTNFFASRIILKNAQKEFGIYPGDEEIHSYLRKLKAFTGVNGEFSLEQYTNFIEKGIGRLGLTESDLTDLVSDILVHEQLSKLLNSGIQVDRNLVQAELFIDAQKLSLEIAKLDIKPIQEKMNPTDEELKSYWETIQDAFKTEEKRRFRYFTVSPDYSPEPPALPELAKDASADAKKEFETAKAKRTADMEEAKRKAQLIIGEKVDDFLFQLEGETTAKFVDLAKQNGWTLKETTLTTKAAAPEDLKVKLRASSDQGLALDSLFSMQITADPLSKISPAIAIGEDAWLVALLEEVEEVRNKSYDEAKDEVKTRFIQEKANDALKVATTEAAQKIADALKAGKSFADAAKDAGITSEITTLNDVTSAYTADPLVAPKNLFESAKYVNPGELLAEPIYESDRSFIVKVVKREVEKKDELLAQVDTAFERAKQSRQIAVFNSWITEKIEAAGIEELNRN